MLSEIVYQKKRREEVSAREREEIESKKKRKILFSSTFLPCSNLRGWNKDKLAINTSTLRYTRRKGEGHREGEEEGERGIGKERKREIDKESVKGRERRKVRERVISSYFTFAVYIR